MKQYRTKVTIRCKKCGCDITTRKDYVKQHSGLCDNCRIMPAYLTIKCKKCGIEWQIKKKSKYNNKGLCISCAKKGEYGMSAFNSVMKRYTNSAKKRGIDFNLTSSQFKLITQQNCYYCGVEPLQLANNKEATRNGDYIHNGIDRIDSSKGYEINNVVPCCSKCNYAKLEMSQEEFIQHIIKIYNHISETMK